jgi:hypothetical protein
MPHFADETSDLRVDAQFFGDFPHQRYLDGFTRFDVPTG